MSLLLIRMWEENEHKHLELNVRKHFTPRAEPRIYSSAPEKKRRSIKKNLLAE
jgi:hypothetical protein